MHACSESIFSLYKSDYKRIKNSQKPLKFIFICDFNPQKINQSRD